RQIKKSLVALDEIVVSSERSPRYRAPQRARFAAILRSTTGLWGDELSALAELIAAAACAWLVGEARKCGKLNRNERCRVEYSIVPKSGGGWSALTSLSRCCSPVGCHRF